MELKKKYHFSLGLIGFLFGLLFIRIFYLQIIKGKYFSELSARNKIRRVILRAERGDIFARHGEILAETKPALTIAFSPHEVKKEKRKEVISSLSALLSLSQAEIEKRIKKSLPYEEIKIERDVDMATITLIEENKESFPAVKIIVDPRRNYPFKELFAHLIGYVDEINFEEYQLLKKYHYEIGDYIGKTGLEKKYDRYLHGKNGYQLVMVNAYGHRVKILKVREKEAQPQKGNSLFLTIDLSLQQIAARGLEDKEGTIIVTNPKTGEILVLFSSPSFDPHLFLDPLPPVELASLFRDENYPLMNRAVQCRYPPGSIFKIITFIAAVEHGINWRSFLPCQGKYQKGDWIYRCWQEEGHLKCNLTSAFAFSCNVFFYQLGEHLSCQPIIKYAQKLGLERTFSLLPEEIKSFIPTPAWKKHQKKARWYLGDTLHLSIGQAGLLTTPFTLINLINLLANKGTLYQPYLVKEIKNTAGETIFLATPSVKEKISLKARTLRELRKALRACVKWGTGYRAQLPEVKIWGKTGTAQIRQTKEDEELTQIPKKFRPHAWFAGWGEKDEKQISLVIFVENGGSGGEIAAPLARKIFSAYFKIPDPAAEEKNLTN